MQLDPRYKDLKLLGKGVSSTVYKAFDQTTQTFVAIKHINAAIANDPIGIERFRRELQITRKISHPQVISIYDLHEGPGGVFLVMEYLPGRDLSSHIKLSGPLPVDEVLGFLKQALSVLQSCHRVGVIHRDIKPQNIFVLADGSLKLLDFGISRMTTLSDLTQTGASLGSPEYMAPELFSSNCFDPRTDLYALGVVTYEMLTGKPPFDGETLAMLFRQHLSDVPAPLADFRPEIPEWLAGMVQKLLAKKAVDRYQSAGEALFDFENKKIVLGTAVALKRLECVNCHEATLLALPVCLNCGYGDSADPNAVQGSYALWAGPASSQKSLGEFLTKTFNLQVSPNLPRGGLKLTSGMDLKSVELVKKHAEGRGLQLEIRQESVLSFVRTNAFLLLCGAVLALPVAFLYYQAYRYGEVIESGAAPFPGFNVSPSEFLSRLGGWLKRANDRTVASLGLGVATPFLTYWFYCLFSAMQPPLVDARAGGQRRLVEAMAWYREILEYVRVPKPKALREMDLALMETFLLALNQPGLAQESRASLEGALKSAFRLSTVMAEIYDRLAHLRKILAKADRIQTSPEYLELEETYSRLNNKLVFIRSFVNGVLSKLLIGQDAQMDDDLQELKGALVDLDQELKVFSQAQREVLEVA